MDIQDQEDMLYRTLEIVKDEGEVVEIRILKTNNGTVSGYFDDNVAAVNSIRKYVGKYDIYVTLNPTKSEMLARCSNRLQTYAKSTTSDQDIAELRHILIDIDPVRASGISSTKEEKKAALAIVNQIRKEFKSEGLTTPIITDSGNGFHLLLRIELANTKEHTALLKEFLATLDFLYSNNEAQVDVTTFNPSRIVKFYGTQACKGDNTKDRPHRWSKILREPDSIETVSLEQIQQIIVKMPKQVEPSTKKSRSKSRAQSIDVEKFIEKHDLDLAYSAPYGKDATKYILKTCPWNHDHTNSAAYIIQFGAGGVSAGCHHSGCSKEDWKSLQILLQDDIAPVEAEAEIKQADKIIKMAENIQCFINELETPYAAVQIKAHWEVMEMKSAKFKKYLTKLFYDSERSAPSTDSLNQAVKVLEMKAEYSDKKYKLQRRIAESKGNFYYDLCDADWRVVKINAKGCHIDEHPPILFTRNKNMKSQVDPDFSAKPSDLMTLVEKHFLFKKESDKILFATYLVTSFLPEIPHVILVLYGEKGAAKSTTMRMVKSIVDPAQQDLLSMPSSKADLSISLSNNYMPCFDNLDSLSAEKSDLLCMAATGGAFSKRTLYSDEDETILQFKRCVGLNGINIVATRPDLLDRSVLIELERIPKSERKTEREIWSSFNKDVPKFLGAIFNTLSATIPLYEEGGLAEAGRMADFTYWGYAIAGVLGVDSDQFLEAYLKNQDAANEEALSSHPVAAAVIAFMKTRKEWSSSVTDLLKELEDVANRARIDTHAKTWANDANVLSRRLREVKSNLEEVGIYHTIRNGGNFKKIKLENQNLTVSADRSTRPALERPLEEAKEYCTIDEM